MEIVGTYISELRNANGLTQPELAGKIGVSERTVRNMESGRHGSKTSDVDAALELLRGSWVHVAQLLRPGATAVLAKKLAQDALSGNSFTEEQRVLLENLTPEQKRALLDVARQMT